MKQFMFQKLKTISSLRENYFSKVERREKKFNKLENEWNTKCVLFDWKKCGNETCIELVLVVTFSYFKVRKN